MRLKTRLIFSYCLITVIPIIIFSSVIIRRIMTERERDAIYDSDSQAVQACESIDVYIDVCREMVEYFIRDSIGDSDLDNAEELIKERQTDIMAAFPGIVGIALADESDRFIGTGMSRISRDRFADEKWFSKAADSPGKLMILNELGSRIVILDDVYSVDSYFSFVEGFYLNGKRTVIMINVKKDVLKTLIDSVSGVTDSFVFIVDSDGDIVYAPVNTVVYRLDEQSLLLESGSRDEVVVNGIEYNLSSRGSKNTDWRIISVISSYAYKRNSRIALFTFIAVALSILIMIVIISILLANSFNKPVQELIEKMRRVEEGDLSVRVDFKYKYEIGMLGRTFDDMLDRMNVMMEQIQTEKQRTLQARLKSIQEQIKPHFLYNTLDTINWMARGKQADDIVKMVEALTRMFRLGLSQGRDYITVRDEIEHITNYLYIQGVRYGSKLRYDIDTDANALKRTIPKLILQPLVENSIYHGIKLKKGGGEIHIKAKMEGEELLLSVYDTGAGMTADRLHDIREEITAIRNGGIGSFGITYIIERLGIYTQCDYDIEIDSAEGEFTEVIIRLRERGNYV